MSPSNTSLACASGAFVSISRVRKLGWPDRDTLLWPGNLNKRLLHSNITSSQVQEAGVTC